MWVNEVKKKSHQVRRKSELEIGGFVWYEEEVGGRVVDVGDVDVPELEVPEAGDRHQEVPGKHRTHAQVAKYDAEKWWRNNVNLILTTQCQTWD